MQISVGDWVRFYRDAGLVIGVVEYVGVEGSQGVLLSTDVGSVYDKYVLEVRQKEQP